MRGRRKKSSRRSGASTLRKQLRRHAFYLDQCLGKGKIAAALRKAGARVVLHHEHFPEDAPDSQWLRMAGRKRWIVLTKDKEIRRRQTEREALIGAGVAAFVLTSPNLDGDEMAQALVRALTRMVRFLQKQPRPFVAAVHRDGSVTPLLLRR